MSRLRRVAQWALGILVLLVALAQLIQVDRSNPPVESEVPATREVREILRRACYDCHSNETVWPVYSRIAPISWLLAADVRVGRQDLNFSTWGRYDAKERAELMEESWDEIVDGKMPPRSYLLPHPCARLSSEDRERLRDWLASMGGRVDER